VENAKKSEDVTAAFCRRFRDNGFVEKLMQIIREQNLMKALWAVKSGLKKEPTLDLSEKNLIVRGFLKT